MKMCKCDYCHNDPEGKTIGCVCGLEDGSDRDRWTDGYSDHYHSAMPTTNEGGEPPQHPDDVVYMQGWEYYYLADRLDYEKSRKGRRFPENG